MAVHEPEPAGDAPATRPSLTMAALTRLARRLTGWQGACCWWPGSRCSWPQTLCRQSRAHRPRRSPERRSGDCTWPSRRGLLAKLVADAAPHDLRGTAFGFFNLATGAALLLASLIAGSLWDAFGAEATFAAGACFAALAAAGVLFCRPTVRMPQPQKEGCP